MLGILGEVALRYSVNGEFLAEATLQSAPELGMLAQSLARPPDWSFTREKRH